LVNLRVSEPDGSKRLAHLLALFGIAERPSVVKATTGINNIPTKAWMVRSECICSSVAPSTGKQYQQHCCDCGRQVFVSGATTGPRPLRRRHRRIEAEQAKKKALSDKPSARLGVAVAGIA
jgi:hypothetical protein